MNVPALIMKGIGGPTINSILDTIRMLKPFES